MSKLSEMVQTPVPYWLLQMGPLGLFAAAALDSSVLPLPLPGTTDFLLLFLVSQQGNPWLLVASALAGSVLGAYTNWSMGKRCGEAAIMRRLATSRFALCSRWIERHSLLAVFIPALLPPPCPLSPFVVASAALGVSRSRFLQVFSLARSLRYGLITWLGMVYGKGLLRLWSASFQPWSSVLSNVIWVATAVIACVAVAKAYKQRTQLKSPLAVA